MKTKILRLLIVALLFVTALPVKAQQAKTNYQNALNSVQNLANGDEKSENKGKSLSIFFEERKVEAGLETAFSETHYLLLELKKVDFYAAYYFLVKVKSPSDMEVFRKADFTPFEQDIIRSKLSNYTYHKIMSKNGPPPYPDGVPVPGSSWGNTVAKTSAPSQQSNNTVTAYTPSTTKTSVAYQTDNGKADLKRATQAYGLAQYKEAIKWAKLAADKNNAEAMFTLGTWYNNELGIPKDPYEAIKWHKKAAELGNINAMYQLGEIYANGAYHYKGSISRDKSTAITWFNKAIQAGQDFVPESYQDDCYRCKGTGKITSQRMVNTGTTSQSVSRTNATSISGGYTTVTTNYYPVYETSTSNCDYCKGKGTNTYTTQKGYGYGKAKLALAEITGKIDLDKATEAHKSGDFSKALRWYKRSAEKGNAQAMYNISTMYKSGKGVKKDDALALEWLKKAEDAGYKTEGN